MLFCHYSFNDIVFPVEYVIFHSRAVAADREVCGFCFLCMSLFGSNVILPRHSVNQQSLVSVFYVCPCFVPMSFYLSAVSNRRSLCFYFLCMSLFGSNVILPWHSVSQHKSRWFLFLMYVPVWFQCHSTLAQCQPTESLFLFLFFFFLCPCLVPMSFCLRSLVVRRHALRAGGLGFEPHRSSHTVDLRTGTLLTTLEGA